MNKDLQEIKSTEVAGSSPADMMRIAISGGTDLDKAEKFLILQEKWEANAVEKEAEEIKDEKE